MSDQCRAVEELARLYGVATSYVGADHARRHTDVETTLSVLRALGVDVNSPADSSRALDARRRELAQRVAEPVICARAGQPAELVITLPQRRSLEEVSLRVELEDGSALRFSLSDHPYRLDADFDVDGESYVRLRTTVAALPLGYHRLVVEAGSGASSSPLSSSLVICAPACPRASRGWGGFLPLYALRTEDDWGVGSYSDLGRLGAWLTDVGATFVGGLPLYPLSLADGDPSPYRPVSRLAYNDLYVDPRALAEYSPALLSDVDGAQRISAARAGRQVDYQGVAALLRSLLEPMSASLLEEGSSRRCNEFMDFLNQRPEIVGYSAFRAAGERGADLRTHAVSEDILSDPLARYYAYGQWAAAQQLQRASEETSLYSDLPVGAHPEGYDPHRSPCTFVAGLSAGSPPDLFFSRGQDWGFLPFHPDRIRDDGYAHAREVLARAFRSTSYVRIDHIMGLQRLYVIPSGADATRGTYLRYRADEFYALISLEAHRAGARVIGEDLGTAPRGLHRRMAKHRVLGSWVFEFESTTETPLPDPPANVLASLSTHDTPRFNAYLWGQDIDDNEERGDFDASEADARRAERALYRDALFASLAIPALDHPSLTRAARRGALAHLARSAATLVMVDLEELTGEESPQNRPGTTDGNWVRRAALSLEEMSSSHDVHRDLEAITRTRQRAS